jgi:hypothetical protein
MILWIDTISSVYFHNDFYIISFLKCTCQGRIQDFKLGGVHLKKIGRTEGYFVWKNTILRQKIIFFPIAEGGANKFGVFRVKNHDFMPKKHFFPNFGGGARRGTPPPPPLDPPLHAILYSMIYTHRIHYIKL